MKRGIVNPVYGGVWNGDQESCQEDGDHVQVQGFLLMSICQPVWQADGGMIKAF